jgi:hypothetical protein
MRFLPAASLLGLSLALVAPCAHADPPVRTLTVSNTADAAPSDARSPEPETRTAWYGYQTLVTDAVANTLLFASLANDNTVGAYAGIGVYAGAAPIVHLANGQYTRAALSLGVRVLMPALGVLIGYASYSKPTGPDAWDIGPGLGEVVLGFLGAVGAMVVDATALTYKTVKVAPPPPESAFSVSPQLGVDPRGGVRAGIGGTF